MYNWTITISVIALPIIILSFGYIFAKRPTMNFLMRVIPKWKKRYVVVHLRFNSGLENIYNIIPSLDGLTKISDYSYNLSEKYSIMKYRNRFHYIVDENNVIPKTFKEVTDEDILFQAAEIQTALNNTVMEYLFSKQKEILIMGLFIISIICVLAIGYNIYQLDKINAFIQIQTQQVLPP